MAATLEALGFVQAGGNYWQNGDVSVFCDTDGEVIATVSLPGTMRHWSWIGFDGDVAGFRHWYLGE